MENIVYIPIGTNCLVANFLKQRNLRKHAFPFDWNCTSISSFCDIISNDFDGLLDEIFIGEKTKRMLFEENQINQVKVHDTEIYPVICKKYNILFPHDFDNTDKKTLSEVKNKYSRRIERFRDFVADTNNQIVLVYNVDNLNDWQKSVYLSYEPDLLKIWNQNLEQITKLKDLFVNKPNVKIISLNELEKIKKID